MIEAIVAVDENWGIGHNNELLVHIPEDMKFFKFVTTGNTIIIGRKTYDSLPKKPLPDRLNIVVTRKAKHPEVIYDGVDKGIVISNLDDIKSWLTLESMTNSKNNIIIIGGGFIYKELIDFCDTVYVTKIYKTFPADTFFPNLDEDNDWEIDTEDLKQLYKDIEYQFLVYRRKR